MSHRGQKKKNSPAKIFFASGRWSQRKKNPTVASEDLNTSHSFAIRSVNTFSLCPLSKLKILSKKSNFNLKPGYTSAWRRHSMERTSQMSLHTFPHIQIFESCSSFRVLYFFSAFHFRLNKPSFLLDWRCMGMKKSLCAYLLMRNKAQAMVFRRGIRMKSSQAAFWEI